MKEFVKNSFRQIRARYHVFRKTPHGKKILRRLTNLVQILIIGFILYQLSDIGWSNFLTSLPTHPLFYLLFLFIYFLLPIVEVIAYKIVWGISFIKSFPTFIRKRIFNKEIMGYSGELVLMQWAVSQKKMSGGEAFKDIRDVNIISSAASTFIALGILAYFIFSGRIKATEYIFTHSVIDYTIGGIVILAILGLAYRFRSYLFSMPIKLAGQIFLLHATRMMILFVAQILQWHIVLPDVSLNVWFTFLSINIIISRIPFVPSHELVATGTNIELAKLLKAPVAGVAGLFLVHNVLDKLLNLAFYLYYSLTGQTDTNSDLVSEKPTSKA